MPFTQDRRNKIELAFYSELIPDLYMSGLVPQLYLSAVQSTQHCLAGGMDESVIYSFSIMGLQLGEQEEFEQAFRYEDLARELSARHPNTFGATRGMNGIVWCNMHSRSHPEEIVEYCQRGIQCGKNCGDLYNAGLCYGPLMWNLQVQGADFALIEEYARECQQFSERNYLSFSVGLAEAMQAGWIAPMKAGYEPIPMQERIARWEQDNHVAAAGSYYAHLALSHYYLGEHQQAAEALAGVERYLSGLTDNVLKRQWYLVQALNALKLHECRAEGGVEAVLAEIAPLVAKVEIWAALGPLLQPYLSFFYAERERVTGEFERARSLYLAAIESAHRQRYAFLEGHLNECLAEMQLEKSRGPARPFLLEAARLYRSCRAERKEMRLYERHPEFFEKESAPVSTAAEAPASAPYALPRLDVGYLMRSALAISAEIEQDALLRRIMQTVIESSGAQHGYLLIVEDGHLRVRAERHAGGGETVWKSRRLEDVDDICTAIVRYVFRTGQRLVLADANEEGEFKDNSQVRALGLRSVLCLPVLKQARLVGVLYLENRLAPSMFTPSGTQTTELLAAQAAISLENARLVEEMKQAETALAREREHLAVTLHSIGDAVIVTDTTSHVVMINRVAEVLTGWREAEARGKSLPEVFRIINEQSRAPAEDPVRKVLESGMVVGLANHTALVSRDGRQLAIADSAAPIRGQKGETLGVVLVFRDVTEARRVEDQRDTTIELLRIVNANSSLPALISAVTHFFQEQSGCEAVGVRLHNGSDYPYFETQGLPQAFVSAENRLCELDAAGNLVRDSALNPVLECMCGNVIRGRCNADQPFFTAGGSFWTNSTSRLLASTTEADRQARTRNRCHGEGYESVALLPLRLGAECLGLIQLCDRREGLFEREKIELWESLAGHVAMAVAKFGAERALRQSEAALKEADRRKNEFLAMLSHELRNPLAPISNSLFILERVPAGGDPAKRAQAIIGRQVTHLTRLVDDLLDITRISRGKIQIQRERCELGELVRRTVEDYRQTVVANGMELKTRFTSEAIWLNADSTRIAQVVGNLLGNAAKFTQRGGRVELTLEREQQSAVLRVCDTGEGIEPEMLGRLFEPFSQARQSLDRTTGGLGLGLALVKGLVELHGGTATAASQGRGQGAEFTVRLPLLPTPAPAMKPVESLDPQRRRVLIIEDNVDAADSLRSALEVMGHEVAVAYDGLAGIETAREFLPDFLLCDIGLPEMDGFEVARRFRADPALGKVMLVALTGYARPEDRQRATEAGYTHHIAKPPSLRVLEQVLGSH
jgi:PAS domain S-box-containing protein